MQCEKGFRFFKIKTLTGDVGGFGLSVRRNKAVPSGLVFVLLCTTSSEVHPAEIISVLYPVVGGETTGSAAEGGSGVVGRAFPRDESGQKLAQAVWSVCVLLVLAVVDKMP